MVSDVQLSVQINTNCGHRIKFEIERISLAIAVVSSVVDETDDYSYRQLTRKQFLVTDVQVTGRYGERFADGIFSRTVLESFCVRQIDGRTDFDFTNQQRSSRNDHFELLSTVPIKQKASLLLISFILALTSFNRYLS